MGPGFFADPDTGFKSPDPDPSIPDKKTLVNKKESSGSATLQIGINSLESFTLLVRYGIIHCLTTSNSMSI